MTHRAGSEGPMGLQSCVRHTEYQGKKQGV